MRNSRLSRPAWASRDAIRAAGVAESYFRSLPDTFTATYSELRTLWEAAGEAGLLCNWVPAEYGGMDVGQDVLLITLREQVRFGQWWFGNTVHSGVVPAFLMSFGSEEQKCRYLPPMANGSCVAGFALTESSGGSNFAGMTTCAVRRENGYILTGEKTFVTNGMCADVLIVAARSLGGSPGTALFLVATDHPGVSRTPIRMGVGQESADLATFHFDGVQLDTSDLLVDFDMGLPALLDKLSWERLLIAVMACASAEYAIKITRVHLDRSSQPGPDLSAVGGVRALFADCIVDFFAAKAVVDATVTDYFAGSADSAAIAITKYLSTETAFRVADRCAQLHGAAGFTADSTIGMLLRDSRSARVYGGANEVMKEIALQYEP